jgi:hypothetical protein
MTGIAVSLLSNFANRLAWCGSRCCTTTNAILVLGGKWRTNSIAASNLPAEPPMPTIGQLKFFLGRLARDVCRAGFDHAGFLRVGFAPERAKPLFGVRFPAMTFLMLTTSTL